MSQTLGSAKQQKGSKLPFERKLFYLSLSSLIPFSLISALYFVNAESVESEVVILLLFGLFWVLMIAFSVKHNFVYQIRTLNTLIEAIQSEDYSLHSSHVREAGDLAELYQQISSLTGKLKKSRQDEKELSALLERVINQINVAIVVCDDEDWIVLVNDLAANLLKSSPEKLIGLSLGSTELIHALPENGSHLVDYDFPGARGRWQINMETYVQDGKKGRLIFITDLEQVLSEEELKAWQSLIRVIAHEVNNSLTPITSLCQTMETLLSRELNEQNIDNLQSGLDVIKERALNLKAFISDYARIARLPEANKVNFDLMAMLERVKTIYTNEFTIVNESKKGQEIFGDPAQIEQVLINLVKNALEANIDSDQTVEIRVNFTETHCEIKILDNGSGITNPANLFVPFYTTKPKGAGIGLALCRRIAASHNGEVSLHNRVDAKGAIAIFSLPLSPTYSK